MDLRSCQCDFCVLVSAVPFWTVRCHCPGVFCFLACSGCTERALLLIWLCMVSVAWSFFLEPHFDFGTINFPCTKFRSSSEQHEAIQGLLIRHWKCCHLWWICDVSSFRRSTVSGWLETLLGKYGSFGLVSKKYRPIRITKGMGYTNASWGFCKPLWDFILWLFYRMSNRKFR